MGLRLGVDMLERVWDQQVVVVKQTPYSLSWLWSNGAFCLQGRTRKRAHLRRDEALRTESNQKPKAFAGYLAQQKKAGAQEQTALFKANIEGKDVRLLSGGSLYVQSESIILVDV